jgi:hypothetical protein
MGINCLMQNTRGVQVFRETVEFILPDRKRRILEYVGDQPSSEWIRVGERTWVHEGQQWLEGYAWMDKDILLSGVWSHRTSFECLGAVVFEGKTYTGYGANDPTTASIVVRLGEVPKLRRSILVDGQTGLAIYEIFAGANSMIVPFGKYSTRIPATLPLRLPCDRSAPPMLLLIWGGRSGMVRCWHVARR